MDELVLSPQDIHPNGLFEVDFENPFIAIGEVIVVAHGYV